MTRWDVPISCSRMAVNLWGLVDTLKSRAAFQRHLSRLQKWTDRNLRVLRNTLNTSQQGAFPARKTDCLLGCMSTNITTRSRKVIIHPYLAFVRPHVEYRKLWWYISKTTFHIKSDNWNRAQRSCGISLLKDTKSLNGQGSKQPDLTGTLMFL